MIGIIGFQAMMVALRYEIYERTNDPLALGYVGLVQTIPVLLLTLPAGQVADWFDRKFVICGGLVVGAVASAGLCVLSIVHGPLWMMYVCIGVRSVAGTFNQPARQALMPQTVPLENFPNAITWNSSTFQLALAIGPAAGGMIIAESIPAAYAVDALCLMLSFVAIAMISRQPAPPSREPATLESLGAGVRFVVSRKVILAALTLDLMATLFGGANTLLPIFAKDILKVGPTGLGWLAAAPAVGSVVMALILAHSPPLRHAGRSLLFAVFAFGAATVAFGFSTSYPLSLMALFLTGAFDNISVVVRHTIVQMLAPDAMRGRISAVNSMFIGASNRLSDFESGLTAKLWGPVGSVVFGGIGAIAVVIGAAFVWPELGKVGSLSELKSEPMESGEPAAADQTVTSK
jgi:MFS family permease